VRTPPTLLRILVEAAVVLGLHAAAHWGMVESRLLERVLSPTGDSGMHVTAAACFLLLRLFVLLLLPGWVLARVWLWATSPRPRNDIPR